MKKVIYILTICVYLLKITSYGDNSIDKNPQYLALAEYYLGRIYQAQGNNEQALILYMKAKATIENANNNNIKGLIYSYTGQLYYNLGKHNEVIDNFKSVLKYFNKPKALQTAKNRTGFCHYIAKCRKSIAAILALPNTFYVL